MIPIGCLTVDLLIKQYPQQKEEIVKQAILERQRHIAVYHELSGLISFHSVRTIKIVGLTGIISFGFLFLFMQVSQIADWYERLKAWRITVPLPLVDDRVIDLGSKIPTSTTLDLATQLPSYNVSDSINIAFALSLLVMIAQIIYAFFRWKDAHMMKQAITTLKEEMTYLYSL